MTIVNICGIPHEIIETEQTIGTDTTLGQINYGEAKIYINKGIAPQLKKEALCHEIIHGILIHIGRGELSEDECFVQSLGNAINQTFDVKEAKE